MGPVFPVFRWRLLARVGVLALVGAATSGCYVIATPDDPPGKVAASFVDRLSSSDPEDAAGLIQYSVIPVESRRDEARFLDVLRERFGFDAKCKLAADWEANTAVDDSGENYAVNVPLECDGNAESITIQVSKGEEHWVVEP